MKKSLEDALFLIPIAAIFAIGIAVHFIVKTDQPESSNTNTMSGLAAGKTKTIDSYAMLEPFAENHPFNFTDVMQHPMNPFAWMQVMMNAMQMNQMMHQMMTMPMQTMNPTIWMNPHAMLSNPAMNTVQQPMSPEEYKKWYDQYHSQLEADK